MEIFIDDKKADTAADTELRISLSVASTTDQRKGRSGYTRSIRLPRTSLNDTIFGFAADINVRDNFNATDHTGRIEHDGAVLFEGPLTLKRCETAPRGESFYEVYIVGAAKKWAAAATLRRLGSLAIEYVKTLTGQTINQSWTNSDPVKWLPVAREKMRKDYSSGSSIPAIRMLTSDDYHPFLHAATLLKAIFARSGYTLVSDFVDGEFFNSLYISGMYREHDVSIAKANMDFLARASSDRSAVANYQGRVYANPYLSANTIGNLVDKADFSNNGCFQPDGKRMAFVPTDKTAVGFQYRLAYLTDYKMKSSTELTGFNLVYVGSTDAREFVLPNPYENRSKEVLIPSFSYKLVIFDHDPALQYQLRYTSTPPMVINTVNLSARSTNITTIAANSGQKLAAPMLCYRASSTEAWSPKPDGWGLYDGYVKDEGQMSIEVTLRTPAEEITPANPKFFDDILFGGGDPGMNLTVLGDKTWVRPIFYTQPTEGTEIEFADVCAHDASQMDFIDALRQMFNLRFQTDNRAKTVSIEPANDYFATSDTEAIDWTGKLDLSGPVAIEDLGGELAREMAWSYRTGDGAVARLNRNEGGQMGRWSASVDNSAAANGVSEWQNPMFTPSLGTAEMLYNAPSAIWMQAGDVEKETLDRTENLNFPAKIVRFEGMKPLPVGESWGWPLSSGSYPKIAFHAPESDYTLCFEDRDEAIGLHSHYDREVRLWQNSRRLTARIALSPLDIENLSFPTGHGPSFRSLYRLTIDGETALYRLEQVVDYSPDDVSTKCIFIKHIP